MIEQRSCFLHGDHSEEICPKCPVSGPSQPAVPSNPKSLEGIWETTTRYGRADLTLHPLIREAYKVAVLIEMCGGSEALTRASSAAFALCEALSEVFAGHKLLLNATLEAKNLSLDERDRLRAALELMYDKWENGTPCTEDWSDGPSVGNAFKLTEEEERQIIALIPGQCTHPALTGNSSSSHETWGGVENLLEQRNTAYRVLERIKEIIEGDGTHFGKLLEIKRALPPSVKASGGES